MKKELINNFFNQIMNDFSYYKGKWAYEDGCIYSGLESLYNVTGNEEYYDFIKEKVDYWLEKDGKIRSYNVEEYNIDNICSGRVLFLLYAKTKDEKYKNAIEEIYRQVKEHPRTKEKNFWHKKIYPNQVWLDGLYMGLPFYTIYEKNFNNKKNYKDIINQILNVEKHMKDEKTGLYYHGYDESRLEKWADKETGNSPNFWIRAMGWFVMALIDVINELEDGEEGKEKIVSILNNCIDSLVKYEDENSGMWYQVINTGAEKGNYLEVSGSLMVIYSILKGVRLGVIKNEEYKKSALKGFETIVDKYLYEKEGKIVLDGICGVAGLGNTPYRDGSKEYYYSEKIILNDYKGVGAFMMAYSEVLETN